MQFYSLCSSAKRASFKPVRTFSRGQHPLSEFEKNAWHRNNVPLYIATAIRSLILMWAIPLSDTAQNLLSFLNESQAKPAPYHTLYYFTTHADLEQNSLYHRTEASFANGEDFETLRVYTGTIGHDEVKDVLWKEAQKNWMPKKTLLLRPAERRKRV